MSAGAGGGATRAPLPAALPSALPLLTLTPTFEQQEREGQADQHADLIR